MSRDRQDLIEMTAELIDRIGADGLGQAVMISGIEHSSTVLPGGDRRVSFRFPARRAPRLEDPDGGGSRARPRRSSAVESGDPFKLTG